MAIMSFRDSMFLMAESRERPTHVGSLLLFDRPEGAGPDFLGELHRRLLADPHLAPTFRHRAERSLTTFGQWSWVDDPDVDLDYHVRLSALPRPGRIRELLELVSRLHGTLLDRHRPLWEVHLIEGVEGDRFAVYFKIHHAMMDGVTGARHLQKALSTDPETVAAPFWQIEPRSRGSRSAGGDGPSLWSTITGTIRGLTESLDVVPAIASSVVDGVRHRDVALPFEAPPSILNRPITGARRFAAQSWPLKRIQRVRERTSSTLNDVVLAMCAGALRRYLDDLDALPDEALVAALPVALGGAGTGNRLGAILVTLATDEPDPATRLARIRASGQAAKGHLEGRSPSAVAALSLGVAAGIPVGAVPGASSLVNPGFNLIISNVPGPTEPLFWEGAKLDGIYPLSVPLDGQGLNITVFSYADHLEFGLTGDRRSVPRLQRLLTFLEESLVELEAVADGT